MVNHRDAIRQTIDALGLKPEHEALVEAACHLASVMDDVENAKNASLWRQYRESILALFEAAPKAESDDGQTALLALVRPAVGNAKNAKAKNPRPRAGKSGRDAGNPPNAVAAPGGRRRSGASA